MINPLSNYFSAENVATFTLYMPTSALMAMVLLISVSAKKVHHESSQLMCADVLLIADFHY
jgi:hypothetical protein